MKIEETKKKLDSAEQDLCVACWNETEFKKDTPIDQRIHYVLGAGQLCCRCWKKIYGEKSGQ